MRSRLVFSALFSCSAGLTQAAEPTSDSRTLDTIRVEATLENESTATQLPLTLRETPQSVTVFSAERLEDQDLTSLAKVLNNTPGVYTYAWDTERVIFSTRGFVIDSMLYDGVPATENSNTSSVDDTIDTALFERIEIVRGATGLMTGAGSPAASINLVRKHADSKDFAASLDFSAGSWNDRRIEGDVSLPITSDGDWRARAVGVYEDRDSYQSLYSNKKKVLYAIVDGDISPSTKVSFGADYVDNAPRRNTWGSFPLFLSDGSLANWSRSVTTAADWSFWDRKTTSAFAQISHSFSDSWSLQANLSWRKYEEDLALFYVYGFPDTETGEGLDPYAYRSDGNTKQLALDVRARGNVDLFGRTHELVFGYNGSRVKSSGREYGYEDIAPVGNFFEWEGGIPEPDFDPTGSLITDITTRENGFYAVGRFSLADPLKLIAGVRMSTWKTDHFYAYDSSETLHTDYDKVLPYAGLIFDVSKQFSLFASFTQIFKPQFAIDAQGRFLDPLDGSSVEVGLKGEHFDGRLNTSLTIFETKQDNVATVDTDPETGAPVDPLPGGLTPSHGVDGTRTRGFEIETSGAITDTWKASLGWSRYEIEDADGVAIRTFTPRNLVRFFTTWSPPAFEKLTIGGGVNYQSSSYTTVGAPDSLGGAYTLRQGNVTNLSLMAKYDVTDKITVQVNGSNLLDKKYYVLDEYDNTFYGEPLAVSASVNVRF